MYSRILNCDYEFVSPWWDEVSLNAKDLVRFNPFTVYIYIKLYIPYVTVYFIKYNRS